MILLICFAFVAFTLGLLIVAPTRTKSRNGIYSEPGDFYALKFLVFYLLLQLRKLSAHRKRNGAVAEVSPSEKEGLRLRPENPQSFDAVFFSGANERGDGIVIARDSRGSGVNNCVLYLWLHDGGFYRGKWLPDTCLPAVADAALRLHAVEPMREWAVGFDGAVETIDDSRAEVCRLRLDGRWTTDESHFDYDTGMAPATAARVFAKEAWNAQFWTDLQKAHQSHYEQFGKLSIRVRLGEFEELLIEMPSFRDHSCGTRRDWKLMHRYAFHHIFLPASNWKAVVGVVCQPHTCSTLECGFVSLANGQVSAVTDCSMRLDQHAEGGAKDQNYAFVFTAGGERYDVEVRVVREATHFYGSEAEAEIRERVVEYVVNGVRGTGIAEWSYRNSHGKTTHA